MKRLKESRAASFAVIAAVYMLAGAVGVAVYRFVGLAWWLSLLIADVAATVFTFIFSLAFGNASVYDPYWSVQPPVILIAFAFGRELTLFGIALILAVGIWALRLTANWAYTFGGLTHQDWRYTMLSEKTGALYPIVNFVGIHLVPTLVVWGCTLPAVYAIISAAEAGWQSYALLSVSLIAVLLQGCADIEMHKYRKNRQTPFIRTGLWRHSRHPNYLGEILMWWGIGLSVLFAAPDAPYLIFGALSNTALFLFVSIPLAEGKQSRKAGYKDYKRETRVLLPIKKFRVKK